MTVTDATSTPAPHQDAPPLLPGRSDPAGDDHRTPAELSRLIRGEPLGREIGEPVVAPQERAPGWVGADDPVQGIPLLIFPPRQVVDRVAALDAARDALADAVTGSDLARDALSVAERGQVGALEAAIETGAPLPDLDAQRDELRREVDRADKLIEAHARVVQRRADETAREVRAAYPEWTCYLRDKVDEATDRLDRVLGQLHAVARERQVLLGAVAGLDARYGLDAIRAVDMPPGRARRHSFHDMGWLVDALREAVFDAPEYLGAGGYDPRQPAEPDATPDQED